ncbi:tRNA (adenosine(37)-N6)-threonylcarbamoyltransferase complex dimerization subunit type 1 TsaB [Sphingomonas nostoxanthinifaciens]|uniref:tRNA (adenosine(37)-N6)-threonylcarbamoyltransferase complex dimerization subunit type 1 TsaB n=1 Tax=Sphingomonas nostoxanthinifaciens TaxID=2872652 RepID=UPI001CC1DFCF|nr:tRNA (adenosine(37)-N6)-threonylcarbamoyltransferase complex dimerization subunit type 1 TsaB [Sphingomonas nostoxanthinifaciens]UAK24802.1 tRNA (adenosine(37)-N6)-threonylcarbamoyltransferase complex dimerization subunit type 1 TsaB [Sphingomonas nostoxanthinifaciens]
MTTLVIETATAACSVALIDGAHVVAAAHEIVGRGHAERLVPMIGEVLAAAGIARADAVLVDCGPGSFTGIRVGLAAARAFGLAWGVPVHGYSAPALIAVRGDGATVAVAIEGGHGEIFVQRFASAPFAPLDSVRSLRPEAAATEIAEATVLGSGAQALVVARGSGHAELRMPNAADAVLLPEPLAALPATPLYGRAPDAVPPR